MNGIGNLTLWRKEMQTGWYRTFLRLGAAFAAWPACDAGTRSRVSSYIRDIPTLDQDSSGLIPEQMFWPPRVVRAVQDNSLMVFFGSGVSFAARLPSWMGLLRQAGLETDLEEDPFVSGDMLTLAELAAQASGAENLQDTVRKAVSTEGKSSTTAHYLLAALAQKVYITTNYDDLFEKAWRAVHEINSETVPRVVTTDDDLRIYGEDVDSCIEALRGEANCVLFKLHGCVTRRTENLILTRSDYRRHYRTNMLLFSTARKLMAVGQTLFLGFGHRDPEIARLIDDVVHDYEKGAKKPERPSPGLYSLQFGMEKRTPEIFAARGIVALRPRPILSSSADDDVRGIALGYGLTDLVHNADPRNDVHKNISMEDDLSQITRKIEKDFNKVFLLLKRKFEADAIGLVGSDGTLGHGRDERADRLMDALVTSVPEFSNQGCYLVRSNGTMLGMAIPNGLDKDYRMEKAEGDFGSRPYFRQAKSHREAFVSDSFRSIYNKNATLAICLPLLVNQGFAGLLFLAYQFDDNGFSRGLRSLAQRSVDRSRGELLVIDSNGILLLPPNEEFGPEESSNCDKCEKAFANVGYDYDKLFYLSRRDKRVERIAQGVVPLGQDDDVFPIAGDATVYSVVKELKIARWKVALMRFFGKSLIGYSE